VRDTGLLHTISGFPTRTDGDRDAKVGESRHGALHVIGQVAGDTGRGCNWGTEVGTGRV
jgi:hypothetical protein